MHDQEQSPLLRLPMELQLTIYKYAVVEDEALLLNCPCGSNFGGDRDAWDEEQDIWARGEKAPPQQPGLSRTCTTLRAIVLPIFYQQNKFRAHYYFGVDMSVAVNWLKRIGLANRCLLRDLCFWDKNPRFDAWMPRALLRVKRSAIFRGMGGSMETLGDDECCIHRVTFGDEDDDYYEMVPLLLDHWACE